MFWPWISALVVWTAPAVGPVVLPAIHVASPAPCRLKTQKKSYTPTGGEKNPPESSSSESLKSSMNSPQSNPNCFSSPIPNKIHVFLLSEIGQKPIFLHGAPHFHYFHFSKMKHFLIVQLQGRSSDAPPASRFPKEDS